MSHQTDEDGRIAQHLASHLEAAGVRVWIAPRDVTEGSFGQAIERAIEEADVFAVVLGDSPPSGWVQMEINTALNLHVNKGLRIVPLFVGSSPQVPALLQGFHGIDFATSFDRGLSGLGDVLEIANEIEEQRVLAAARMEELFAQVDELVASADRVAAAVAQDLAVAAGRLAEDEAVASLIEVEIAELTAAVQSKLQELRSVERLLEERNKRFAELDESIEAQRSLVRSLQSQNSRLDQLSSERAQRIEQVEQARHRLKTTGPIVAAGNPDVTTLEAFVEGTQGGDGSANMARYRNSFLVDQIIFRATDSFGEGAESDHLLAICRVARAQTDIELALDHVVTSDLDDFERSLIATLASIVEVAEQGKLAQGTPTWMSAVEGVAEALRTLRLSAARQLSDEPGSDIDPPVHVPENLVGLAIDGAADGVQLSDALVQFKGLIARLGAGRDDYMQLRSRSDLDNQVVLLVSHSAAKNALNDPSSNALRLTIVDPDAVGNSG